MYTQDPRITELLDLAQAEGLTLPYSAEFIVTQEDAGHVVDLETGAIVLGGADRRNEEVQQWHA